MSYMKNCTKCGQKISLREMTHGQWGAFDANTDKPHKHGKGSRKNVTSKKQTKHIEPELPATSDGFSTGEIVTISIVILFILFVVFS